MSTRSQGERIEPTLGEPSVFDAPIADSAGYDAYQHRLGEERQGRRRGKSRAESLRDTEAWLDAVPRWLRSSLALVFGAAAIAVAMLSDPAYLAGEAGLREWSLLLIPGALAAAMGWVLVPLIVMLIDLAFVVVFVGGFVAVGITALWFLLR